MLLLDEEAGSFLMWVSLALEFSHWFVAYIKAVSIEMEAIRLQRDLVKGFVSIRKESQDLR